ncbi:MAG: O-antigen ligase family protein [Oscillospiraceae bacterium]
MNFKIGIDKDSLFAHGIVINIGYVSFATACYSIIGYSMLLRNMLIMMLMLTNVYILIKNVGESKLLLKMTVLLVLLFGSTYLLYPGNRWAINNMIIDDIRYIMLAYYIGMASHKSLEKSMKISAFLILICSLTEPITLFITSGSDGYIVFGLRTLFAAVLFEYFYFLENKRRYLFCTIVVSILILLYGNRSSLLIVVICFCFLYLIMGRKKNRVIFFLFFVFAVILLSLLIASDFLTGINQSLQSFGISSRTLTLMTSGVETLVDNNGRSIIWQNCGDAILQRPWTGYGIGGDRNLFLLGNGFIGRLGGVYAHNFILEIILDFGLIIGSGFLLVIFGCVYKVLRNKARWELRNLFFALIISTAIKLFFSASIWNDMTAYICLGLIVNYYRSSKVQLHYEENR